MVELKKETEQKILEAAKEVFTQKGMEAARMQEIADAAGINKSLLHYYFRTKERLFEAVLQDVIVNFYPSVSITMMSAESSFEEKVRAFTSGFMKMMLENPYVPAFIIMEVNRDPEKVLKIFGQVVEMAWNVALPAFQSHIKSQIDAKIIRDIEPRSIIVNMISLCVLPIVGRPIMQRILFYNDKEAFDKYLSQRAEEVADFVINAMKI